MSGLITELVNVLVEEADLYKELVNIAGQKKELIISNRVDELKATTSQENTTAGKIQRLEKKRLSLICDIANVLNEKEANITLTALANIISDQPEAESLNKVAARLKDSLTDLKELNDQNKVLIENALGYIDFSMNVMRSSLDGAPVVYSASGEEISSGHTLFDVKN